MGLGSPSMVCLQYILKSKPHRYLRTSETRARIKTNTISTSAAVDFDLASVRLEVLGSIFRSDSALDRKSSFSDGVLSQAQLRERCTRRNLDLGGHNVDSGNFL